MASTKTKIIIVAAVAVLLALGTTTAILYPLLSKRSVAPDLPGAWEGTLQAGEIKLRTVFKISQKPDHSFLATMDSIDQGAKGIPLDSISYSNRTVRMAMTSMKMSFTGEMNPNGTEIAGTFQQLGISKPLTLVRTVK